MLVFAVNFALGTCTCIYTTNPQISFFQMRQKFAIKLVCACLLATANADAEGGAYCGPGTAWDDASNMCHAMPCSAGELGEDVHVGEGVEDG